MIAYKTNSPRKRGRTKNIVTDRAGLRRPSLKRSKKAVMEWDCGVREAAKHAEQLLQDINNGADIHTALQRNHKEGRNKQLSNNMMDEDIGISMSNFGDFGDFDNNPLYHENQEENVRDDSGNDSDYDWDIGELIEQVHSKDQREKLFKLLQHCSGPEAPKRPKEEVGKRQKRELDSWIKLVHVVTGTATLKENFYFCSCEKTEVELTAVTLMGLVQFLNLLKIGCEAMKFRVCSKDCPIEEGKLGFISQDYFPSSPIRPVFAVHVKVLEFFYIMNQIGPSSKHAYATALQHMLQRDAKIKVLLHVFYK
jgi:hypothetical protein